MRRDGGVRRASWPLRPARHRCGIVPEILEYELSFLAEARGSRTAAVADHSQHLHPLITSRSGPNRCDGLGAIRAFFGWLSGLDRA